MNYETTSGVGATRDELKRDGVRAEDPSPESERDWIRIVGRTGLGVGGALLLFSGVARRSLFGLALAGVGIYALKRALASKRSLPIVP